MTRVLVCLVALTIALTVRADPPPVAALSLDVFNISASVEACAVDEPSITAAVTKALHADGVQVSEEPADARLRVTVSAKHSTDPDLCIGFVEVSLYGLPSIDGAPTTIGGFTTRGLVTSHICDGWDLIYAKRADFQSEILASLEDVVKGALKLVTH